ncbi:MULTISPECIES: carbon-nitrogen hydrolase family protein [unclassified Leisingera]|uniref:carbon-nitrogen hydrolase family protein n=1 Tax=unclassified Leisingera TaxID=2614906 RepID=UPI000311C3CF|nr:MULTISPECIES: carbon-nitrogen hydrolase family protein [unclassified Leisingera]KIC21086.1 hydrolase [Leisingera sp. ANG-S3]KIC25836.1 hydrolase [Leisingera sp. ANG-M6]KIC54011.1 hydrolase [Leisingera sp. ANG-S]KID09641.1 hydrolase [Leisingera sp. ANG1]
MTGNLNIAVAQSPADLDGPQARLAWLGSCLTRLQGQHTDLLVLPELFLTGYNIGSRVSDWAEPADGPSAQVVAELAREHQVAIHYGFAEQSGGDLFNSASCIGKDGNLLASHRKLLLPPGFEGDHFSPGETYTLFELEGFKAATLICYDAEFPETFRAVAQAGAELVLVPTALGAQWGVVANTVIPARAFENGVFVCYANSCGHENGMDYFGGSCVVAPNGQDLARAGTGEELLKARMGKGAVPMAQSRLPYLTDRLKLPDLIN